MSTSYVKVKMQTTVEIRLPWPATAGELAKAYALAEHKAKEHGISILPDDWCEVTVEDDEIVLSFVPKSVSQ